jgi:hypothetical protein
VPPGTVLLRPTRPLARTPARTSATATGPRLVPAPPVRRAVPHCARRRPPLFTGHAPRCALPNAVGVAQSHRAYAMSSHVTNPPSDRAGPLLHFSAWPRTEPDPPPPFSPLYRASEPPQKGVVPASLSPRCFSPALKHIIASPVLPRIGPSA